MTQKLELTWIGKDVRPRLEPRILVERPELSYHADHKTITSDIFDNRLIFGDNLLALKALEQDFAGQVKCVFIDPPYNTGSAFTHYDDGVEHSVWLSLMRDRIEIIHNLLQDDGLLWMTIDDNECHYLKVLCDEVFGRSNFVGSVIWEKSDSPRMDAQFFSARHDFVLVYAKNVLKTKIYSANDSSGDLPAHYNKVDEQGRSYYLKPLRAMGPEDTRSDRPSMYFPLSAPDGSEVYPRKQDGSDGRWRWSNDKYQKELQRVEWIRARLDWTPYYRVYGDMQNARPPESIWFHTDVGSNRTSKAEVKKLLPNVEAFGTPKPEGLVRRIIALSTNLGDIVLDSFAGSGTTGAVAHKMGRRWIMIELGEHCHTHIIPRLKKVVDGTDLGGITEAVQWKGGGGFRYYRLAPSLLEKDRWGNWIISRQYNAAMLAEAMCKHEGFKYAPSETVFWQQGQSTENDFIYTTTQTLTREVFAHLSEEVGPNRTLLICCMKYDVNPDEFDNLTIRKIPNTVLGKCEFGHDDYSMEIANLPQRSRDQISDPDTGKRKRRGYAGDDEVGSLFDDAEGGDT